MDLPPWSDLPALALCKVYQQLPSKDVLAASSTCVGWRLALSLVNRKRNDLPLHTSEEDINRNKFLISLYGVKASSVTIVLNSNLPLDYVKFSNEIWPRVCELRNLTKLTFVATVQYLEYEKVYEGDLLRRLYLWPLLAECHKRISDISFRGCGSITNKFLQKFLKQNYNLQRLEVTSLITQISSEITNDLVFNNITELALDYGCLNRESLRAIVDLRGLDKLALYVRRPFHEDLTGCWNHIRLRNPKLYLHCVRLEPETLRQVKDVILADSLNLVAIRVLFCKMIDLRLVKHLYTYSSTLKEITWIDAPLKEATWCNPLSPFNRKRKMHVPHETYGAIPNPVVLAAWRCVNLEKLTIQGYYQSCDDLLGIARLRGDILKVLNFSHLTANEKYSTYCDTDSYQPAVLNSPKIYEVYARDFKGIRKCLKNIPNWPIDTGSDLEFNMNTIDESDINMFLINYPAF